MADAAISEDGLTRQQRESARIGCFMHLRDLPPRAVEFVRQWEAAARERLREREERNSVHAD
jgi:hypothetical protein